jgi:uncharacterized membrane protein HdeD (DUF308 family)
MPEEVALVEITFHPVTWGSFMVRGLIALIVGILVLIWTGVAVQVAGILIGILMVIAAILALVLALRSKAGDPGSVMLLIVGVLGLIAGFAGILHPWIAAEAFTAIIAFLMVYFGLLDLSIAIFHPDYAGHQLLLGFSGVLSIILGGIFFFLPSLGATVLVTVYLGIFAIIYGIVSIIIGFKVKKESQQVAAK